MFNKITGLKNDIINRSTLYIEIGKDIFDFSKKVIRDRLKKTSVSSKGHENIPHSNVSIENLNILEKNFIIPESDDAFIQSRQNSLRASQGVADHSGSSYHGPGKPGEKVNSNMSQRNFENHQGN